MPAISSKFSHVAGFRLATLASTQQHAVLNTNLQNKVYTTTALPVRIKQKTPNMQIICNNMQFDVALDESRFSMEVPEGYIIQKSGVDFKKGSEEAFIETLRIWAEIIEDGQFPDSISLENVVKVGPKFDKGLKRLNLIIIQVNSRRLPIISS